MSSTFHVQLNGGPVHVITTKTGQYNLAAVAAVAMFDYERLEGDDKVIYGGYHGERPKHEECVLVKIWVPSLIDVRYPGDITYGPYYYGVTDSGQTVSVNEEKLPKHLL